MRPHRLRVTAFGAFGGTVEVCFDDLAASGLFLLHGETGAGKTTLLDAIGFALYGRVPGERGKTRRLRSDHAAAGTRTEVRLEATIGGRRMRITRKPEQDRPKLRGSGTTTEQAKILLEEFTGASWQPVSTRAGEADAEINDLMGMSADQFFQVVLLPQGQFAQFLHADAGERSRLLQRLFGTDRFRAVEEWLANRRRSTAREMEESELGIRDLIARIAQAAGPQAAPDETAEPDPPPIAAAATWAAQLAGAAAAGAAASAAGVAGLRVGLADALDRQRDAERLQDRQRRRRDALRTRGELTAAEPGVEDLRRELAAAARAAEVAPALAESERTAAALAQARAAEQEARRQAGADPKEPKVPKVPKEPNDLTASAAGPAPAAARLRAAAQEHVVKFGLLEGLRSLDRQAADEDEAAAAAQAAVTGLTVQIEAATEELSRQLQQRPGLSRQRDAAREAGQKLPSAAAGADRYRRAADDANALVEAKTDVVRQSEAYVAAKVEHADLLTEAARLRIARIDGMRAELAATLVDGAPCPVCGSLDHPELCELRGEQVTRDQEETADEKAAAASERAETIGARLGAADERVATLSTRLTEAGFAAAADPAWLQAELRQLETTSRELQAEAAELAAAAARLGDLQIKLDALDQGIAAAEKRLTGLGEQRESARHQAAAAEQRSARHRETLAAQLDGQPDLDSALAAVRAAADALTAAADAADAAVRAARDDERATALATAAAAAAGFDGLDSVRQALREPSVRVAADRAIREHEAKAKAVAELLADPDLEVPLDPPADVAGAVTATEAARKLHDDAVAAGDRAAHKAEQLADLVPALAARLRELEPVAERAAQVRSLADLASRGRREHAADDAVLLRAGRAAGRGRGRGQRAAAEDDLWPILARAHRRAPRRRPFRARPARL